jgi:hypothetical protein
MRTAIVCLRLGGLVMSSRPRRPHPAEVFQSFVRELALLPQGPEMLRRLRQGHQPDPRGWCRHPAHSHRWERYPCATMRMVDLAEATNQQ